MFLIFTNVARSVATFVPTRGTNFNRATASLWFWPFEHFPKVLQQMESDAAIPASAASLAARERAGLLASRGSIFVARGSPQEGLL